MQRGGRSICSPVENWRMWGSITSQLKQYLSCSRCRAFAAAIPVLYPNESAQPVPLLAGGYHASSQ